MKLLKTIASTALLAGSAVLVSASTPLINLVGDQAPLVISVNDVPSLVKNWGESPWAKTWDDPQVQKFFAPLRAKMDIDKTNEKVKAETGHTLSELIDFASGDALFAITTVDFDFEAEDAKDHMPFLMALELGSSAGKVQKMLTDAREKHPENAHETEDFDGVTINIEGVKAEEGEEAPESMFWAIADDTWLITFNKDTLVAAIDALKKGGVENAYGKSTHYLARKEKAGASQISVMVNFAAIVPRVQELIAQKASEGQQNNPFLQPTAFIPALGLDAWNSLYFDIGFSEAQTTMTGGFTFSEERGLLKMFSYGRGPVPRPAFIPEKWLTVSTGKFSVKSFYDGLEATLGAYNPGVLGMGQMYVNNFNQKLGIDIKRDFFGSFGSDIVTGYAPRPGASADHPAALQELDQFLGFSLDNPKGLLTALDAFTKAAGPQAEKMLVKRDYLGTTINTIALPTPANQPAKSMSYAVAKNYLLVSIGTPAALESVLQNGQSSFWDRSDVKQALAKIPADASTFTFYDTRLMVGTMFETLAQLAKNPGAKPEDIPVDPTAKPDTETLSKYWGDSFGYMTRDSEGYFFKSTLEHKK